MSKAPEAALETEYPTVSDFVRTQGWIEIGDQEGVGFVVRALDHGGLVFETHTPMSITEAMATPEQGIAEFRKERA